MIYTMCLYKRVLITTFLIFSFFNLKSQSCYNADFELGNFTGWVGKRGNCCPISLSSTGISNGRQTIMTAGVDPNTCGGLSTVYSGNFSARLGNDNVGSEAEGLSFSFLVTPQSTLVQYAYAVVFEDPGHAPDEQPRFVSRVRLSDGSIISCTDYTVTAASDLDGFQYCPGTDSQGDPVNIAWRDWSTVTVDLSPYIGQSVTLEFETGDCSLGAHFGYAYIDAIFCSPTQISVGYCVNQTSATLSAPTGFSSYLWQTGDTTQTISVNPTLYDSLSCFLTTVTGCELTLTTELQPTIPSASFSYDGQCEGLFTFTNTSSISNNGQGTYSWNFGDGTTSQLLSPTHIYTSPGNYLVSLQLTTDDGCIDTFLQTITVYPIPIANFIVADNCFGDETFFTNTTFSEPGYSLNYYWDLGNNIFSQEQSPTYTYSNLGTYNVSLIVSISGTNCRDTIINQVNIRPNPISNFIAQNNCFGISTQFLNNSQFPDWSISNQYLWSFGEFGSTSLIQNPNYTYSSDGIFNVSLLVVSTNGIISCSSTYSNQVEVYANPISNFITQSNACVNDDIIFTNLSSISQSSQIINYIWNFGDGSISNIPSPSHSFGYSGVFNVSLTATSNHGCVDIYQQSISINPLSIVSFLPNNGSGCPPLTINFDDSSTGVINSWMWNFGDGSFSNLQNPSHTFQSSGVYQVSLQITTINGCVSTSTSPAIVVVHPNPNASFVFSPSVVDEYNPVVSFLNYSTGATNHFWNFGDETFSSLINPQHSYSNPGNFTIELQVENQFGCVDRMIDYIMVTPIFTFYIPNSFTPSDDNRNEVFFGKGTNYKSVRMQIFNRWGEKIFDETGIEPPVWNGKLNNLDCQIDVYVYQFFVTDISDNIHIFRGKVTLVR